MTMTRWHVLSVLAACVLVSPLLSGLAWALGPGEVVENFRLLDQHGKTHELYASRDRAAIVLLIQGNGCPIARKTVPALAELREQYRDRNVEFFLLNANLQDDRASVAAEAAEFRMEFPILLDDTQLVAESLGVDRTAEVFVIEPRTWRLAYRGPLDDRLSYESERAKAQHSYLRDALDAVLAHEPVKVAKAESAGCLVNLPEVGQGQRHAAISYERQIAPLVTERCSACHAGPEARAFELASYEQVRTHAREIRGLIRAHGAAPASRVAHADLFEGASALSAEQRKLLVHWIEAGAPRPAAPRE